MRIGASVQSFNTQLSRPAVAERAFTPVPGESFQSSDKHMGDFGEAGKILGGMIYGGLGCGAGAVGGTWAGYAIGNSSGHPVVGMALGGIVGLAVGGAAGWHLGYK